jgi:hypothetical protein
MTFDQNGLLYVVDAGKGSVLVFNSNGTMTGELNGIANAQKTIALAVDAKQQLYAMTDSGVITRGRIDGSRVLETLDVVPYSNGTGPHQFRQMVDLSLCPDGAIYVLDKSLAQVKILSPK